MMVDPQEEAMGSCTYCKDLVLAIERYVVKNGDLYHKECDQQRKTFYDPTDGRYEGDRQCVPGREYESDQE